MKKNNEAGPWYFVSDPVPLGSPTMSRCLGYDGQFRVTTGGNCLIQFAFDGTYLRESGTGRVICAGSLSSGSAAYLLTSCTHSVDFAYARKGGSSVCVPSSDLCLVINSAIPGTVVTFQDTGSSLLTYIYKGAINILTVKLTSFWMTLSTQQNCMTSLRVRQTWMKTLKASLLVFNMKGYNFC